MDIFMAGYDTNVSGFSSIYLSGVQEIFDAAIGYEAVVP